LTEVLLPPPVRGARTSYRKVRARRSWDFAVAGVALALQFDGEEVRSARVVLSGAAPVPWRSPEAEEALRGRELTPPRAAEASEAALSRARALKRNAYKLPLFRALVREELLALRPRTG
jgi:xanthine dehydrogenase YagS FAD-binding subunit